jgi:hypothetical protein
MPHCRCLQWRRLAGLDGRVFDATFARCVSGGCADRSEHLLRYGSFLLVRRWVTLLVQRLQQRLAVSNLSDHRSSAILLRAARKWLPRGNAASGHAVQLAGRVMRP